jgi:hypothetical protein
MSLAQRPLPLSPFYPGTTHLRAKTASATLPMSVNRQLKAMNSPDQWSNTLAEIEAICAGVLSSLHSGTNSSWESLQAHCQAGIGLMRLKEMLPHGQFLNEVKTRFGIGKQWSASLMKLAHDWDDIEHAVTWARESGPLSLSVDGALALVKKWRQAMSGDIADDTPAPEPQRGAAGIRRMSKIEEELRQQLEATQAELMQANARIRFLETEIARLQSQVHPATEAYDEETAIRSGGTLPDFLSECGVKSPVDWTNEDAPPDEAEEAA